VSVAFKHPCDEAYAHARASDSPCAKRAAPWVLAATILGSSMAFIDGTVVNVTLPALQSEFRATLVDLQWVIESYALLLAALLLTGGSLGDRYGRRRVFLIGTGLFAIASLACALATSVAQLVAARAIQGIGGALLVPGSLAILSASFDKENRGRAIGTWSGFTSITAAIGPVLGGWLIDHLSWRAAFLINVPIACAVIAISLRWVPESRGKNSHAALDWPGALVATASLAGIVYALLESSNVGWTHPRILVPLAAGAAGLFALLAIERRAQDPMLPLGLFRSRTFAAANLLTFFLYGAMAGLFLFLPMNLIQVQGDSATSAGAAILPLILLMFLLSRWSGGLFDRFGSRLPLTIGCSISALGFLLLARASIGESYWTSFFPGICVLGVGMATTVPPLTTAVMSGAPAGHVGAASGINNAVSRVAGLISVAVFSILMLRVFEQRLARELSGIPLPGPVRAQILNESKSLAALPLPESASADDRGKIERAVQEAFVGGFRTVILVAAGLTLLSALIAWTMITDNSDRRRAQSRPGHQRDSGAVS
jgi:EmrB/QacA subfamily drug resistance transporter